LSCERNFSLKESKYPTKINVQRMTMFCALFSVELIFKSQALTF
jgi:hypothetical protein